MHDFGLVFNREEVDALLALRGEGLVFVPAKADVELDLATRGLVYSAIPQLLDANRFHAQPGWCADRLLAAFQGIRHAPLRRYVEAHYGPLVARLAKFEALDDVVRALRAGGCTRLYVERRYGAWARSVWNRVSEGAAVQAPQDGVVEFHAPVPKPVLSHRSLPVLIRLLGLLPGWLAWWVMLALMGKDRRRVPAAAEALPRLDGGEERVYVPFVDRWREFFGEMVVEEPPDHRVVVSNRVEGDGPGPELGAASFLPSARFDGHEVPSYRLLIIQLLAASVLLGRYRLPGPHLAAHGRRLIDAFSLNPAAVELCDAVCARPGFAGVVVDNGGTTIARLFVQRAHELGRKVTVYFHGLVLCGDPLLRGMPPVEAVAWGPHMAGELRRALSSYESLRLSHTTRVKTEPAAALAGGARPRLLFAPSFIHPYVRHTWWEQIEAARVLKAAAEAAGAEFVLRLSPRGGAEQLALWKTLGAVVVEQGSLEDAIRSCHLFAVVASTVFCDFVHSGGPVAVVDLLGWVKGGGLPFDEGQGVYRITERDGAAAVVAAMIDELSADDTMRHRRADLARQLVAPSAEGPAESFDLVGVETA